MPWQPIDGTAVVEACGRLREHFTADADSVVVLVRHVSADGGDGGADAPRNQLVPQCAPRAGDHLVTKTALDAFEGTGLHETLRDEGVTDLVLAGLSTAHGVAATATTALRLGYGTTITTDATASVDEPQYRAALTRLTGLGAHTTRVADLVATRAH